MSNHICLSSIELYLRVCKSWENIPTSCDDMTNSITSIHRVKLFVEILIIKPNNPYTETISIMNFLLHKKLLEDIYHQTLIKKYSSVRLKINLATGAFNPIKASLRIRLLKFSFKACQQKNNIALNFIRKKA